MKKYGKYIIAIIIAGILVGGFVAYKVFEPQQKEVTSSPDFTMNASELYHAYDRNPDSSSKAFNGKIVEVSGEVASISYDKGGNTNLTLLANPDDMFGVTGEFASETKAELKNVKKGDKVYFKGEVAGKLDLGDVILKHASLIEE